MWPEPVKRQMASGYRRTQDGDTWHFCENCSHWPTEHYLEQRQAPRTGELCDDAKLSGVKGNLPLARTSANIETPNCGDRLPDVAVENIENVVGEVLIIERQAAEIILVPMCYGENTAWTWTAHRAFFHCFKHTHFTLR